MEFKQGLHFSDEIEAAVMGQCLLEKNAFSRAYELLDRDVFWSERNAIVFDSILEMFNAGLPIELLTVADYLMRTKRVLTLGVDGVPYYLTKLTGSVVSSANLEYHCYCLREMWTKRELIKLTYGGIKDDNPKNAIRSISDRLNSIQNKNSANDWASMDELIVGLYKHQDKMTKSGGVGLLTGFKGIDEKTGGFHPGQLIVLGARPSVGKSAIAGQIAISVARSGKKVGIISLEMSNNEIAARIASIDSGTDFSVLFRALYRDEDQREMVHKRLNTYTAKLPIYVSDKTNVSIHEIRAKATKLKNLHGLDLLVIDYLQLVEGEERINREQQVSRISRGAKVLAKEMEVPVLLLCQLNREVTKRKGEDRFPQLSDLRESGAIEQDADAVIFLHSDWMSGLLQDENGMSTENSRELVVRKWRNAPSNWRIPLYFDAPKMMFTESAQDYAPSGYVRLPYKDDDDEPF